MDSKDFEVDMLAQQLLNGIVLGAIYSLFSLGFTVIFGVLHVINLMYGVFFAFGAYVSLYAATALHLPFLPAIIFSAVVTGIAAIILDALIITPLRRRKERYLTSLLATMGMALFMYSLFTRLFGAEPMRFPAGFSNEQAISLLGVTVNVLQLTILAIVLIVVIGLFWFLRKTRWGIAVRAVGDQETAALIVGLSPFKTTALVSFIGGALAAVAGTLIGLNFNAVQPFMGETMMLQGFAVVVIGGLGSMPGALIAGMLLGVVEILVTAYLSSAYRDAVTFALLLATLWTLPQGLMPSAIAKKV